MSPIIENMLGAFRVESADAVTEAFDTELKKALQNDCSSLHILPSFLSPPTGQEKGEYIALDMGGSNVRAVCLTLQGGGHYVIQRAIRKPLQDPVRGYDLTSVSATGAQLYAFIADLVGMVAQPKKTYSLGFTFSYPMKQDAADKACLTHWTKEIHTSNVIGHDIKTMLQWALEERGLKGIAPVAILNDTVGCLMAGAYTDPVVCTGSICGTGYNTCYVETSLSNRNGPMIVDMESGNFAVAPSNSYDEILDRHSTDPGRQRFEKMVSGKYMGELLRLAVLDLAQQGLLPLSDKSYNELQKPFALGAEALNWLISDHPKSGALLGTMNLQDDMLYSARSRECLTAVARAIVTRAEKLIAASFTAILARYRTGDERMAVAVDGSVFEKMPGFSRGIERILRHNLRPAPIELLHVQDGSVLGAAIAAAQMNGH